MSLTELNSTVALVVIDLQVGTTSNTTAHPVADVLARASELLDGFRSHGLPVAIASVDGTPAGQTKYGAGAREFPPAFSEPVPAFVAQPGDITISRRTWSAFSGTDLDAQLSAKGVTQIVLAGLATSFGVESTARDAYDRGYSVVLAVDAMTDPSVDSHNHSVARVFPALGQTDTAAAIVTLLKTA